MSTLEVQFCLLIVLVCSKGYWVQYHLRRPKGPIAKWTPCGSVEMIKSEFCLIQLKMERTLADMFITPLQGCFVLSKKRLLCGKLCLGRQIKSIPRHNASSMTLTTYINVGLAIYLSKHITHFSISLFFYVFELLAQHSFWFECRRDSADTSTCHVNISPSCQKILEGRLPP